MSNKIDKKALKGPDTFQATTHVVLDWIQAHAWLVLGVAGFGVLATAGWLGMTYVQQQREQAAVDAIYASESALKQMEQKLVDERDKKIQEAMAKAAKAGGPKRPLTEPALGKLDYSQDYAPVVEKIKAAIKDNGSTRAAVVSALNLSSFLIQQKQYGEALAVLDLPKFQPGQKDLLSGFWHMHRGLTLLENQKADEALEVYKKVLSAPGLKPFHAEALLKSGVAYEVKGDNAQARESYEKLGREFPNTEASSSAQQYLRLLELKEQKG